MKKTNLIESGDKQKLTFEIKPKNIASFDTGSSSWIVEPGEYVLITGTSSKDIRSRINFRVKDKIVVGKVSNALSSQWEFPIMTKPE